VEEGNQGSVSWQPCAAGGGGWRPSEKTNRSVKKDFSDRPCGGWRVVPFHSSKEGTVVLKWRVGVKLKRLKGGRFGVSTGEYHEGMLVSNCLGSSMGTQH